MVAMMNPLLIIKEKTMSSRLMIRILPKRKYQSREKNDNGSFITTSDEMIAFIIYV